MAESSDPTLSAFYLEGCVYPDSRRYPATLVNQPTESITKGSAKALAFGERMAMRIDLIPRWSSSSGGAGGASDADRASARPQQRQHVGCFRQVSMTPHPVHTSQRAGMGPLVSFGCSEGAF